MAYFDANSSFNGIGLRMDRELSVSQWIIDMLCWKMLEFSE